MRRLRVAFLGGRILGHRCLNLLAAYGDRVDVRVVVAHKKDGVPGSDWNPPILPLAKRLGFNTLEPQSLDAPEVIDLFRSERIDVLLNPFCNRIIPESLLELPSLGCINFHYGKLPEYKGRYTVTHVILNGEEETVVTSHYMTSDVDGGDIIFTEPVPIEDSDTAKTLYLKCTDTAARLFKRIVDAMIGGEELPRRPQEGEGRYYTFETPNGGEIDLGQSREDIERFIRATSFPPISAPHIVVNKLRFLVLPQ